MKLTAAIVTALTMPAGKTDYIEWDDAMPSFGVRLRNGRKTFVCQYRFGGRTRRDTLGDVRNVKLDDARKAARHTFGQVARRIDPKPQTATVVPSLSLARVADLYLAARKDVVRKSTHNAAAHYFAVHWKPFAARPIASITQAEISARLQEIIKDHGRVSAARARANLSALYSWAMREDGLCDFNPVARTNNPGIGIPTRDRVLSISELKLVWDACGDDEIGTIVRLLALTACRRDEIARLSWSEVDFQRGQLTIVASRCKNGRAHSVPLPAPALELLRAVPRRSHTDFVFGGAQGFTTWTKPTNRIRARLAQPVPHFTLHDLRRSAATGMAELGVLPHVIEAVLNHSGGSKAGVAGIYNKAAYEGPKAAALQLWADHVLGVVEGRKSKIVPLRG
jgi:integrase